MTGGLQPRPCSIYDDVTKYKEKAENVVICSRLRERDKKNMEYYGGDYINYDNKTGHFLDFWSWIEFRTV